MNNYYEESFNIVCDDWEENQPEMYEMVFEPVYYQGVNAYVYKEIFIERVARVIFKNNPSVIEVEAHIIEDLIEKRRNEIIWNKHYAVYVEYYDSDYDYTDSDDD